jgi:hypothetical protein
VVVGWVTVLHDSVPSLAMAVTSIPDGQVAGAVAVSDAGGSHASPR